jgi:hypothetical protein
MAKTGSKKTSVKSMQKLGIDGKPAKRHRKRKESFGERTARPRAP